MSFASHPRCPVDRLFTAALLSLAVGACAEGATLDPVPTGSGEASGDGGSNGDGGAGRGGDGGARAGDGGHQGTPSASEATSVTSTDATSVGSTAAAQSSSSTAATTAAATTAAATTSSTGGGPVDCDPLNPSAACGGAAHCFPAPDGVTGCGEAGNGQDYDPCVDHTDCTPLDVCINFGPICCQRLCTDDLDCPGIDFCYPFDTPLYDGNGIEYGFCNDGFFDCIG